MGGVRIFFTDRDFFFFFFFFLKCNSLGVAVLGQELRGDSSPINYRLSSPVGVG